MDQTIYDMMSKKLEPWFLIIIGIIVVLFVVILIYLMSLKIKISALEEQHKYMENQLLDLLNNKKDEENS